MYFFEELQHPIQQLSGFFAIFINSLLIYLIIFHSPKTLGAYRYLMMYISVFEILYAIIDLVASPVLYSQDSAFLAILDSGRSGIQIPIEVLYVLNVVFCGSFGTSMAMFGIHFVFRYLIMKGNKSLTSSDPLTILVWLLIPIGYGLVWATICMTTLFPTEATDEFLKKTYLVKFPGRVEDLTYFGPFFYPSGEDLDWKPCVGITGCSVIMSISSLTMVFCGFKCYNRIHNLVHTTNHSSRFKTMQSQFLTALIVETLVPVFLMHVPAAVAYSACLLDSSNEVIGNVLTISIALYPALDPLPTIFIISSYRNAVLRFIFSCGSRVNFLKKFVESITDPIDSEETEMEVL